MTIKLALGPIQYYWPRQVVLDYYADLENTALDVVYLGEVVCSRRHELRLSDWLDLAARLQRAGKQVVLSTQVLLESGADVTTMHKLVRNGDYLVEANDMGAVQCLAGKMPFVAGPHLNLYNAPALQWMAELGAMRWVMPLEMQSSDLKIMQQARGPGLQTEVFAYGRMPLAFSARCFTARYRNLPKDDCQFSCLDYPLGLPLQTQESQDFLVLNGIQTQSAKVHNLAADWASLAALDVDLARLSPQPQHMREVIELFDAVRNQALPADQAAAQLEPYLPDQPCNGYWHGKPGLDRVAAEVLS
jgi:collagenase-like PrtC family protease